MTKSHLEIHRNGRAPSATVSHMKYFCGKATSATGVESKKDSLASDGNPATT